MNGSNLLRRKVKRANGRTGEAPRSSPALGAAPSGPCVPPELTALLGSSAQLSSLVIDKARPEYRVHFDDLPGEPRNTDLVAIGASGAARIAISVEAKADETFGELVNDMLSNSATAIGNEKWTNVPQRIQQLARALLPANVDEMALPALGELRYQLLTAAGGALAFAKEANAAIAVLVIHEFVGAATRDNKVAANGADLDRFIQRISKGSIQNLPIGRLIGPIVVPGNAHLSAKTPLYIGKIQSADCVVAANSPPSPGNSPVKTGYGIPSRRLRTAAPLSFSSDVALQLGTSSENPSPRVSRASVSPGGST